MIKNEDLPKILELNKQLGYESSVEELTERFKLIPTDELLVTRNDANEIIAYAHIHEEEATLLAAPRALLVALVVDNAYRGQSIGRDLLKRAEQWAKDRNLKALRLRSSLKREAAHRFYLREGYVVEKTSHVFSKSFDSRVTTSLNSGR